MAEKLINQLNPEKVFTGNVFIRPGAPLEEKLAAINICARIGLEAAGFNLPLIKISETENTVFAFAGKLFAGYDEAETISMPQAGGNGKFDMASLFTTEGIYRDTNGDFQNDFINAKILLEDGCDDDTLICCGNIAAKLAGESTGLSFPFAVAGGYNGTIIRVCEGNSVKIDRNVISVGKLAADRFVREMPYLVPGKKRLLSEAKDFVTKALSGENFAGQCIRLADKEPMGLPIKAFFSDASAKDREKSAAFLKERLGSDISIGSYKDDKLVFEYEENFEWECDKALEIVKLEAAPLISGSGYELLVSVSEESEVRAGLKNKIEAIAGENVEVTVISAFKQGLSYVEERIIPRLDKENTGRITIGFKPVLRNENDPWDEVSGAMPIYTSYGDDSKWFDLPIRWLQELYPVDDIIEKKTGISRELVSFEALPFSSAATYEFKVFDKNGAELFTDSFAAGYTERDYLSDFPGAGTVHPHCGMVTLKKDGKTVFTKLLPTDLDMFWNLFQNKILPDCRKYIEEKLGESPDKTAQPFFKCLRFDIQASEPDYSIGVREDRISSLDFLHEDIYFTTLDYFRVWGSKVAESPYTEPGLILPFISKRNGKGMSVKVTLTANSHSASCYEAGELLKIIPSPAKAELNEIRYTENGTELFFDVDADERIMKLFSRLMESGPDFGLDFKGKIILRNGEARSEAVISPAERPPVPPLDIARELKRMETEVIGYDDYIKLTKQLEEADVTVWKSGVSHQNREIFAFEFHEKLDGDVISHARRLSSKPTFLINNRHHANEVSATNSAFRLMLELLSGKETGKYLKKMNIVVMPLENTDGAAIGYELQKQNPNWMLHVARFNSCGRDFYHDYFSENPKFSESRAFTKVYMKWLPDFVADNHGVPSHEWAQPYSGYVSPWFQGFWLPRGLFYGICYYVENPDFPDARKIYEQVAEHTSRLLNADPEIAGINVDFRDRHTKYAHNWMPNMYQQSYLNDLIYYFMPMPVSPDNKNPHLRFPGITSMMWTTEISDETSQGEYMKLCARTHYLADIGVMNLIEGLKSEFICRRADFGNEVYLCKTRKRPYKMKY